MTCTTERTHDFVFTNGDPFNLPMRLTDIDSEGLVVGIDVGSLVNVSATLATVKGHFICDLDIIPYTDQVLNKGWFYAKKTNTADWPIGLVNLRVKIDFSNTDKHALDFVFRLIPAV
jgi:hypothetical protein